MKPREFWIGLYKDNLQEITVVSPKDFSDDSAYSGIETIHVVEYSAYEKLKTAARDVLFANGTAERALAEVKLKELLEENHENKL